MRVRIGVLVVSTATLGQAASILIQIDVGGAREALSGRDAGKTRGKTGHTDIRSGISHVGGSRGAAGDTRTVIEVVAGVASETGAQLLVAQLAILVDKSSGRPAAQIVSKIALVHLPVPAAVAAQHHLELLRNIGRARRAQSLYCKRYRLVQAVGDDFYYSCERGR